VQKQVGLERKGILTFLASTFAITYAIEGCNDPELVVAPFFNGLVALGEEIVWLALGGWQLNRARVGRAALTNASRVQVHVAARERP
jgi:hypothetical protein